MLKHDDVAEIGARWLRRNGYPIAFANMRSNVATEQPDALGFNDIGESFLLEAKVSRSDFLADKKKPWRKDGNGIGQRRGYIAPEGIIKPEEVPYGWWLLEVYGKMQPKVRVVKGIAYEQPSAQERATTMAGRRRVYRHGDHQEFTPDSGYSFRGETMWLLKIIRRMQQAGIPIEKYHQHPKGDNT